MKSVSIPSRAAIWLVLCSVVATLYFARQFLLPVALAGFIAFVVAPFVQRLERTGLPRVPATVLTTFGLILCVSGIGWVFVGELQSLADRMPAYRANVRVKAADVRATFQGTIDLATSTVRDLGSDLGSPTPANEVVPVPTEAAVDWAWIGWQGALGSLAATTAVAALVLLLAFLMLLRWNDLRDRVLALAGDHDLRRTTRAARDASARVTRYLRRQLLVNGAHGAAMGLALWWIGVPNPLVWALLAATLRFVPYLGPAISTILPILVSFASSDGWSQTWTTAAVLLTLEIVTNNFVEPWAYGASTGISPLAVVLSTVFWTWIWGPMGLVLSTPLTVCLLVVGKRVPSLSFLEILVGDEPPLSRSAQLQQCLLEDDQDGAWESLRLEVGRSSRIEAVDRALVPALVRIGGARIDGRIDDEVVERVGALAHRLVDELLESEEALDAQLLAGALRVHCIPVRGGFDSAAARLLGREFTRRGMASGCSEADRPQAEILDAVHRHAVDVVVVSSVAPARYLVVRALCKSLLALDPRVEVLVGLWGEETSRDEFLRERPSSPRLHVVTTLAAAVAWSEGAAARIAVAGAARTASA